MRIAVVGATGLVGSKMLQVLDEQKVQIDELIVAASERSVGKEIVFQNKTYKVISVDEAIDKRPDIAIFSAGAAASKQYAPKFAAQGTFVIDNSSAWRMEKDVPLVVPEINADTITKDTRIIANPNCSTIQMVMALAPIHKAFGIKRLVIATYQSVSGSGLKGINQLETEEAKHHQLSTINYQLSTDSKLSTLNYLYTSFSSIKLFNNAYTVRPETDLMPVLRVMFLRCEMTVWMEMFIWSAISLFIMPLATATNTSISRFESSTSSLVSFLSLLFTICPILLMIFGFESLISMTAS